jgi:hypothetical protein
MPRPPAFRFRRWLCRACLGLLVGVCGDPADAGQSSPVADALALDESGGPNEPQREVKSGKVARAIRVMAAPVIDGRLDDEAWHAVPALTGFAQRDPDNGDAMSEATFVRIAYDDRFLYLAILCQDRDAAAIAGGLGRRDEVPQTDQISIGLDPRHDHLTGFFFQTNPSGWQGDLFMYDDDRMDRDFNAVWEVRTQVVAGGWSAEFRIPFSQLRFTASPSAGQVWGMNAQRQILRRSETGSWVPKPRGTKGEVSFFGHLVFDAPLAPPRRLELTPYTLARAEQRLTAVEQSGILAGADVRVGLGTASTLAATINPDFGQVEQDPAVLNLSIFENFFPERRSFFLEDSRTFVPPYNLFQLFHSRRIGRRPGRLALADGETLVSQPQETTILGASKVTGKSGRWTYGGLTAFTSREYARADVADTSGREDAVTMRVDRLIEPATSYNVFRLQRDVRSGSNVGLLATGVIREGGSHAFTGGLDYNVRWDENRSRLDGHWVATRAPGENGEKTSGGGVVNYNVSRKHWSTYVHADHIGRDFRVGDLGFFRSRPDRNNVQFSAEVGQPDPGKRLRRIFAGIYAEQSWNDQRLVFHRDAQLYASTQLLNFWNASGGVGNTFETLDDLDSRGGPAIVKPAVRYLFFNVSSDSRKPWRMNGGGNANRSTAGSWATFGFVNLSVQATDKLQASLAATYESGMDAAQWITNVDATGDGVTDYVYGRLRRNVVNLTMRGTYAFTRDLTLQGYMQPFVAVGAYDDIRRLARPRSFEFDPVALTYNPDFNNKSLRGNTVLRWEYVRGSTFFAVWELSRADATRPGAFRPLRDLGTAFGSGADHVLMAKVSYWMNQ